MLFCKSYSAEQCRFMHSVSSWSLQCWQKIVANMAIPLETSLSETEHTEYWYKIYKYLKRTKDRNLNFKLLAPFLSYKMDAMQFN